MATTIQFIGSSSIKEIATLTPSAPMVVQVEREDKGYFTVYANLEGMEPVSVFSSTIYKDLIFEVDVPVGVKITMESESHVIEAKMQ